MAQVDDAGQAIAYDGSGSYIFTSYSHEKRSEVYGIVGYLQKRGYNVWLDEGIHAGSKFWDVIDEHIDGCDCFIALLSKSSVASQYCRGEVDRALAQGKEIIWVLLEEMPIPSDLWPVLETVQAIEKFRLTDAKFYVKLLQTGVMEGCKDTEEFQIQDDILIKYNGDASHVSIPDTVKQIGFNAFEGCDSIVGIHIPASVTMIGKFAFYRAQALQELTVDPDNALFSDIDGVLYNHHQSVFIQFPAGNSASTLRLKDGVTRVDMCACSEAVQLQEVVIPDSVSYLGERAFEGCANLTNVQMGNGLDIIRPYTFGRCSSLAESVIPPSVRIISDGAYIGCSALQSIDLPDGLRELGDLTFAYCISLEHVEVPSTVATIPPYCFYDCISMTYADVGAAEEVGEYAFKNCSSVKAVALSSKLEVIGRAAFSGCESLTKIVIPASVRHIGKYAFDRCTALEHVIFEGVPEAIEEGAFEGDTSLKCVEIPGSVGFVGPRAFPDWTEVRTRS